jgi:hypothetical protein
MASVFAALSLLAATCSAAVPPTSSTVPACSTGSACTSPGASTPSAAIEEGENDVLIAWFFRIFVVLAIFAAVLALARRIGSRQREGELEGVLQPPGTKTDDRNHG